jgi:poly(hydroxyalkanoate) depolymerase family esterase
VIREWLKKLHGINNLERISASLAVLWQDAVTLWQLVARGLLFLLQGLARRVRPPGSNVRKIFRARRYRGSRRREYLVHVPPSYERQERMPLVMVLHGCNQDHVDMQTVTRFDRLADRYGFIVVYPFITGYRGVRLRNCWGWWRHRDIRGGSGEVEDLWNIISAVRRSYRIDPDRIHVTGLSSGAAMAVAMAVVHGGKIASCATVAGVAYGESIWALGRYPRVKQTSSTVTEMKQAMGASKGFTPLFIVHSADDSVVGLRAAEGLRDSWVACYGLDAGSANVTKGSHGRKPWSLTSYNDGKGAGALDYLVLEGYEHGWYGGEEGPFSVPDAPDVSKMIWSFFARHPRGEQRPAVHGHAAPAAISRPRILSSHGR